MSNLDFFESGKGYNIAYNVYMDNGEVNTCCENVSSELEEYTKDTDHKCTKHNVIVISRDGINTSHVVCLTKDNKIIDYCTSQFLGNEKEFKLHKFKHIIGDCYLLNNKDNIDEHIDYLKPIIKGDEDLNFFNSEEVFNYVFDNKLILFKII